MTSDVAPSHKKMTTQIEQSWHDAIRNAKSRSVKSARSSRFGSLHSEQAHRAAYFTELGPVIEALGLQNAFEQSALSIEPTHPVPPQRIEDQLAKLTGLKRGGKAHGNANLSLVSLPMISAFSPDSEAPKMMRFGFSAPLYVLDPLYGFVFFKQRDGKFHNHCFAIDFWEKRLSSMPAALASELWENRSDNMLSGGAYSARFLFSDLIPPEPNNLLRCQPPEIVVRSQSDLQEVVAALKVGATKLPNVELWFRGQGKDYSVADRSEFVRLGIAPYSNVPDSNLTPSLYRRYDNFLETNESFDTLLLELAQWVDAAKRLIPEDAADGTNFVQQNPHARSEHGLTSFQRGLFLQQYGAPSAYLDITSDPLVAAWFATNECFQASDGRQTYRQRGWESDQPSDWPTIYVFPLVKGVHPFLDLSSILPTNAALRPYRQSCGLLGGAGNLARNYCARYVGLKIRLDPTFFLERSIDASFYFPPESEDPALASLMASGLRSSVVHYPITHVVAP